MVYTLPATVIRCSNEHSISPAAPGLRRKPAPPIYIEPPHDHGKVDRAKNYTLAGMLTNVEDETLIMRECVAEKKREIDGRSWERDEEEKVVGFKGRE